MARSNSYSSRSAASLAIAIGLFALAQPVFADDVPATPTTDAAPADPAASPGGVEVQTAATEPAAPIGTEASVTSAADEAPAPRFPRSVVARPLTLPKGLAMIGADAISNKDFSAMSAAPIVGYGITDKLEVQVPYAFAARDFEAKGSLAVDVGYVLARGALGGKLEVIARARGGYDLLGESALPLMLGVHAQYNVTPTFAIISGVPGTQQLRISLAENADMATPIDLGLPLGIGYQPTEQLYLQVDTKLAQINISDSANAFFGADATPASLTAVYNVLPALDIQAAAGTDLNAAGDSLWFLLGARYYAGQL